MIKNVKGSINNVKEDIKLLNAYSYKNDLLEAEGALMKIIEQLDDEMRKQFEEKFADYLVEDYKIRKYVKQKLLASGISKIEIERTAKFVKINVLICNFFLLSLH